MFSRAAVGFALILTLVVGLASGCDGGQPQSGDRLDEGTNGSPATPAPTHTQAPVPTAAPAPTATPTPFPTTTPAPTATPTRVPITTPEPTHTPTPVLTATPATTATRTPVPTVTPAPTHTPTPVPTVTPVVVLERTPAEKMELERAALVALYNATDGPNWADSTNWLTDKPVGKWYGVSTDFFEGRVVKLALSNNQLSGEMPPELGNLANLGHLSLSHNQLTGQIPTELGNLTGLRGLSLERNMLDGCIPYALQDVEGDDLADEVGLSFCEPPVTPLRKEPHWWRCTTRRTV